MSHPNEYFHRLSLNGLSVGDALGEQFFGADAEIRIQNRTVPPGPWRYTDDTEMAVSIVKLLDQDGTIDPNALAQAFNDRYDTTRGYGSGFHTFINEYRAGKPWQTASFELFGGTGSFGNGAAMRVAPLGAYFAHDLDLVTEMAERSAVVTHSHPEGIAGAIAVAIAAAASLRGLPYWSTILDHTPPGALRRALRLASDLGPETPLETLTKELGVGKKITALDTVPFALWCAHHSDTFEECFWTTVAGLGDRDTTCAIACGVNILKTRDIPIEWLRRRENLPFSPPDGPRSPAGTEALDFHLERAVTYFREIAPDATWSEVRFFEGHFRARPQDKQKLQTPEEYRNRFQELLNEGHGWINLNVTGIIDDSLILSLEWPNYPNCCPREWVFVNLSGPTDPHP